MVPDAANKMGVQNNIGIIYYALLLEKRRINIQIQQTKEVALLLFSENMAAVETQTRL